MGIWRECSDHLKELSVSRVSVRSLFFRSSVVFISSCRGRGTLLRRPKWKQMMNLNLKPKAPLPQNSKILSQSSHKKHFYLECFFVFIYLWNMGVGRMPKK